MPPTASPDQDQAPGDEETCGGCARTASPVIWCYAFGQYLCFYCRTSRTDGVLAATRREFPVT